MLTHHPVRVARVHRSLFLADLFSEAGKWLNCWYSPGLKYKGKIGQIQQNLYSWWKRKIANPISKIDDYVIHIFGEQHQEADHWANLGPEGQNIYFDSSMTTATWKAVKGFWDGSAKDYGKIRCGVVIKGVDRDRWVTISGIAVPLKVGTAVAAEVMGVCVLTEILDLVFNKCLCVQNINRCIEQILDKQ